jgi:hypothetical protein
MPLRLPPQQERRSNPHEVEEPDVTVSQHDHASTPWCHFADAVVYRRMPLDWVNTICRG